jgi:hypothetical protein
MLKEEPGSGFGGVIESMDCFDPFCEVVDCGDNVFVVVAGWGETFHKVNAPLTKWASSNDQL